ncbi:hypothetical protein CIRG_02247 [Coccidioides immitis RMSCC 2394]|uniref:Uncharacterized protein n=1 Tax=Coccidioides immitis RMSCC 2394 TaxID=404692 RepID=A0A0J6Y613_COCIT|nr:hypothetical protein CIRG_02247 [Coccidioides immitis RMSCC 2394]
MELMQKYSKDNSAVGTENLDCWLVNLLAHLVVKSIRWSKGELVGLALLALISARTFYSFDPRGTDDD